MYLTNLNYLTNLTYLPTLPNLTTLATLTTYLTYLTHLTAGRSELQVVFLTSYNIDLRTKLCNNLDHIYYYLN